MKSDFVSLVVPTREGTFLARYSRKGLVSLDFPRGAVARTAGDSSPETDRWHRHTTQAVHAILDGKNPRTLPPLDLANHSSFRRAVWQVLLELRGGETISYGQIAERLGKRGGARAVGNACGANPIPLLIPCHRVLAANRRLGGFSGGLDWKKRLLATEGVSCSA